MRYIAILVLPLFLLPAAAQAGDAPAQQTQAAQEEQKPADVGATFRKWEARAYQGDAAAQFKLGSCYANGLGVKQDYTEALRWYVRAGDQGNLDAQLALGLYYANGKGTQQNYAEAYFWLELATRTDKLKDYALAQTAKTARNRVERQLTGDQIMVIEQRIDDWQPTPPRALPRPKDKKQ